MIVIRVLQIHNIASCWGKNYIFQKYISSTRILLQKDAFFVFWLINKLTLTRLMLLSRVRNYLKPDDFRAQTNGKNSSDSCGRFECSCYSWKNPCASRCIWPWCDSSCSGIPRLLQFETFFCRLAQSKESFL